MVGVKPESKGLYGNKFSAFSIASLDFSELVPVRKIDLVPRYEIKSCKGNGFLRLAPSVFPAYGRCTFNSAAFAVSDSQILEGAQAFHNGLLTYKGKAFNLPYIDFADIMKMFEYYQGDGSQDDNTHLCYPVKLTDHPGSGWFDTYSSSPSYTPINEDEYDFMLPTTVNSNVPVYAFFKLTRTGCRFYKILKGCGFDWPSFGNVVTTSTTVANLYATFCNEKFNLMPFLAYCHIYADYFLNPNFYHNSEFVQRLHKIHDMEDMSTASDTLYTASTGKCHYYLLQFFLKEIRLPHHRGMYLNAWNSPLSPVGDTPLSNSTFPNSNSDSLISPVLPQSSTSYVESISANGTTVVDRNVGSTGSLTNMRYLSVYGLRFLQNVFDYCRRNGLFGSKYWEQFWARFGIKPSDYSSSHASKLFEGTQDIDFSAIMSNADTEGRSLGSYAGFGIGSLKFDFNYKSDDYGYVFVVSWLQQIPIFLNGVDPACLRRSFLDYWTPKWDGKTLRAIPMMEISYAKRSDLDSSVNGDAKIFGFTNLYDEYRNMRDVVLGDFVTSPVARNFLFCRNLGFFRSRNIEKLSPQSNQIQYISRPLYESDMSDPFQMSYVNGDRFYLQFNFDMKIKSPILTGASALDLEDGDQLMMQGGTQIS